MSKIKIYQSYYLDEQKQFLMPEFTPLDNTDNPAPRLREFYLNTKVYHMAVAEGLDYWGHFSWKYKEKMESQSGGMPRSDIFKVFTNYPNCDVYFFNPFGMQESLTYNMWEQGQWSHRYIIPIMFELLPAMGIDPNIIYQPQDQTMMCWASNFVANKKFWDEFLPFCKSYFDTIPLLRDQIQAMHASTSGYGIDKNLDHFPFIHERLFSLFLQVNRNRFRIAGYQHGFVNLGNENLRNLKSKAIREGNEIGRAHV